MTRKLVLALALILPFVASASEVDKDAILAELMEGNARYVRGDLGLLPKIDGTRRTDLLAGQHPKAAILSCADSRVPPEHIFRQGLGDLFVARVAGNLAMTAELASLEYGVEHLGVPVIVVMGHSSCGAVKTAVQLYPGEPNLTPSLNALVKEIYPAVEEAVAKGGDVVAHAVEANAFRAAEKVLESPVIEEAVHLGHVRIVVAEYDLATGAVAILDPNFRGVEAAPH